ncbi:MAG TPA: VOC family protein [Stellaceae bacterium]|nr:VOC family protein [Stellaceae bacterium]
MMKLEHYNLKTRDLAATVRFYTEVVGLTEGFYPGKELGPGAWLYDASGTPVVHMQSVTPENFDDIRASTAQRLGDLRRPLAWDDLDGTGTIDHVAFAADDYEGFTARLDRLGIAYRATSIASANIRQIFLRDPNGIILELNFR